MDDRKANVQRTFLRRVDFRTFYALGLTIAAIFVLAWFLTPGVVPAGKVSASVPTPDSAEIARANYNFALNLKTAHDYAVYARHGIRDNGNTEVNGDAGVGQRNGFDGLLGGRVHGRMIDPSNTQGRNLGQARADLDRAYSSMKQLPCDSRLDNGNLGERSFTPGVYCVGDATIDGAMSLNAGGDENAVFVFVVSGNLGTRNGSRVDLTNGAKWGNVFFVVDGMSSIAPNSRIDGSVITRRDVNIGGGTVITGKTYSTSGRITTADAQLGPGTGVLEICKTLRPGSPTPANSTFTFTVGATTVNVPIGSCSGPITVNAGNNVMITEAAQANVAVSAITTNLNNSLLVNADLPNRTATVQVRAGGIDVETVVTFQNGVTQTGFLEICKYADIVDGNEAIDVSGTFNFQISGVPGTFAVSVGQCTQPITVTTNVNVGQPFTVTVTELGRVGFQLERVNTIPANRLGTVTLGTPPGGGSAVVTLVAGDPSQQAIVNFFNRAAASSLKICKIAGPGVPVGTIFRFNITGTAPNASLPTFPPGVPVNITGFEVPAGAAPFGTCRFLPNTFVVGTPITVTEQPGSFGGGTPSPGELRVSRIRYFGLGTANTNTTTRTATFLARPETQAIEYTNFVFNQAVLKVCKTYPAGLTNRTFTFDLAIVDPNGLFADFPVSPVSITTGATAGTSCVFAQGPFTATGTVPPIGTFNLGSQVIVTERAQTGVVVTAINSPTNNTLTNTNLGNRTSTISISNAFNPNNLFNEINFTNATATGPISQAARFDFDGDGKADPSIWTPGTFTWRYLASGNGGEMRSVAFGDPSDRPVPADYDGDGKFDQAVYRNGTWYILGSTNIYQVHNWGEAGDIPVVADYDGDGLADRAVFRPSTGTWWVNMTRDGWNVFQYGLSTDRVMAYDFDGDGKADPTVFRNGQWFIRGTQMGFAIYNFGIAGDIPTVADFDGDRKADIAVYRSGTWYVLGSTGTYRVFSHGLSSDRPVAADYDGDGKADLAVFRPSEGNWYIRRSSSTGELGDLQVMNLGGSSDLILPGQ
jgi:hypothetical protein